jgi:RNA polymerase sigma-70 factor (ECF subfamily)
VELEEHLFRREAGRMTAALTRVFGVHNLALAEDVVQDAFCRALEVWKLRGAPENPSAWLMTAAKRRAIDVLRRDRTARTFAPELGRLLESEWTLVPTVDELFCPPEVDDGLLQMMFTCCQPRLAEEAQIALVLNILCGFSVGEVAAAFLATPAAIQKRLVRGKKALAAARRLFDLADADFAARLSVVHRVLYLLFNEGYHSASAESAVRSDLCHEALRLVTILTGHRLTSTPATFALAALMSFHAARLPARLDQSGNLTALVYQDRSRWDAELIDRGRRLLQHSADGLEITEYHVEAAIAGIHSSAPSAEETDWRQIVALYGTLMTMRPSPIVALNRAIALSQADGPEPGLMAIQAIADVDRLSSYPFYHAALGEMEMRLGHSEVARGHFEGAARLARNAAERRFFEQRIQAC